MVVMVMMVTVSVTQADEPSIIRGGDEHATEYLQPKLGVLHLPLACLTPHLPRHFCTLGQACLVVTNGGDQGGVGGAPLGVAQLHMHTGSIPVAPSGCPLLSRPPLGFTTHSPPYVAQPSSIK